MSESNRVIVRAVAESTAGTTPTDSADWITIPQNSDSLNAGPNTVQSQRIRGTDRMPTDLKQVSNEVAGGVEFELSYADFDVWLAAAMRDTSASSTADVAAVAVSDTFTDALSGFLTAGFAVGDTIVTTNFVTPANNATWTILTVTAGVITVAETGIIADDTAAAVNIEKSLKVGTDVATFTVEKEFADITKFVQMKGCQVGQMSLTFVFGQIVTGSMTFGGLTGLASGTSLVGSGSTAAISSNSILAANVDMDSITYDGSAVGNIVIREISLDINNNLRPNNSLLSISAVDQKAGTAQVTGSLSAYVGTDSWDIYDKMLANTATSLVWTITDSAGTGYIFNLPNIKLTGSAPAGSGENQDVMIEADFTCIVTTPTITRIPG